MCFTIAFRATPSGNVAPLQMPLAFALTHKGKWIKVNGGSHETKPRSTQKLTHTHTHTNVLTCEVDMREKRLRPNSLPSAIQRMTPACMLRCHGRHGASCPAILPGGPCHNLQPCRPRPKHHTLRLARHQAAETIPIKSRASVVRRSAGTRAPRARSSSCLRGSPTDRLKTHELASNPNTEPEQPEDGPTPSPERSFPSGSYNTACSCRFVHVLLAQGP